MKIALIGYGKMGKEIEKIALSRGHEIVSIIDVNNQEDFESAAFKSADVAIEFTNPTAAYNNYMKAFKEPVPCLRRNNERNSPYTQAGCSKRHCHYPGRRYSG